MIRLKTTNRFIVYAFSLVEMLVVIGLIAALMAFLLPAIGGASAENERKLNAASQIGQLNTATEEYYSEYGDYPESWFDDADEDQENITLRTTAKVMGPLLGRTADGENRKDTAFFGADDFAKNKGGLVSRGDSADLLSPWARSEDDKEQTYVIRIDADYDEEIMGLKDKSKTIRGKKVLIMGAGKDGELGFGEGEDKQLMLDNVTNY